MGVEHGAYLRRSPDIRHMVSFYWLFLQPAVAAMLAGVEADVEALQGKKSVIAGDIIFGINFQLFAIVMVGNISTQYQAAVLRRNCPALLTICIFG